MMLSWKLRLGWEKSAERGADIALRERIVQRTSQPLEQQIHFLGAVAKSGCKPENVVGESAEYQTISIRDPANALTQPQSRIERTSGLLVGHELQSAQKPALASVPDEWMFQQLVQ